MRIGERRIGAGEPLFVIAEAGVNHNGDLAIARQLIDVAADAGADAVKFQTFRAEALASAAAAKAEYQKKTTGEDESQLAMLRKLELPFEQFRELAEYCSERGILFLSTPFDEEAADYLDSIGMLAFKTPSGELTNSPMLAHIARKGKPMIVSTGMATLGEVEEAIDVIAAAGNEDVALLHCVSNYPAAPGDVNLRAMQTMAAAFALPVGYSDHTLGIEISLAAAALGATIIEKHFTLDRTLPGPDHPASLEPGELRALVTGIRNVEKALGDGRKRPADSEANSAAVGRRSIVAARDLAAGNVLGDADLVLRRPGTGVPPSLLGFVLGRTLRAGVRAGELLQLEMLA